MHNNRKNSLVTVALASMHQFMRNPKNNKFHARYNVKSHGGRSSSAAEQPSRNNKLPSRPGEKAGAAGAHMQMDRGTRICAYGMVRKCCEYLPADEGQINRT